MHLRSHGFILFDKLRQHNIFTINTMNLARTSSHVYPCLLSLPPAYLVHFAHPEAEFLSVDRAIPVEIE